MRGLSDEEADYLASSTVAHIGSPVNTDRANAIGDRLRERGLMRLETYEYREDGKWFVSDFDVTNDLGRIALACYAACKVAV